MVLALTAISLATQQTIGLSRLRSGKDGWANVRLLLGEKNPDYLKGPSGQSQRSWPYKSAESEFKMKRSQLWLWQTPVMLSNFAILFFVVGLMISVFVRAARSRGDWTKGNNQVGSDSLMLTCL